MTESHDPWEAARERQREEVKAIFAARAGAPVEDRRREFRLSRRNLAIVGAVLAALAVATALIVPALRDSAAEVRAKDAAAQAKLVAAEKARITREQKPHFAPGPQRRPGEPALAHRARLLDAGAAIITADARERMQAGTLDGPVAGTECTPFPSTATRRQQEADPSIAANRYECIAYERHFPLSELEGKARTGIIGVPYWLVVDYDKASFAYCRLIPRAGEGGKPLAFVPVQHACADPLRQGS
ncbi:MAG: hypothetical protein QOI80_3861 [Solirubrobacteraceae bacterium]|nr:hypothetical protein [Solirubrobacteraceae bacterium]